MIGTAPQTYMIARSIQASLYRLRPCKLVSLTACRSSSSMPAYLGQKDAQQLDVDLMSDEGGFKLEQVRYHFGRVLFAEERMLKQWPYS